MEYEDYITITELLKANIDLITKIFSHNIHIIDEEISILKRITELISHRHISELEDLINENLENIYNALSKVRSILKLENVSDLIKFIEDAKLEYDPWISYALLSLVTNVYNYNMGSDITNTKHIIEYINFRRNINLNTLYTAFKDSIWFPGYEAYPSNTSVLVREVDSVREELKNLLKELASIIKDKALLEDSKVGIINSIRDGLEKLAREIIGSDVSVAMNIEMLKDISYGKVLVYNNLSIPNSFVKTIYPISIPLYGDEGLEGYWKTTIFYKKYIEQINKFIESSKLFRVAKALEYVEEKIGTNLVYYIDIRKGDLLRVVWPSNIDIDLAECTGELDIKRIGLCILGKVLS